VLPKKLTGCPGFLVQLSLNTVELHLTGLSRIPEKICLLLLLLPNHLHVGNVLLALLQINLRKLGLGSFFALGNCSRRSFIVIQKILFSLFVLRLSSRLQLASLLKSFLILPNSNSNFQLHF